MSDEQVPAAAHRGELSELRGGSAAEPDALPAVREDERGASSQTVAFTKGDRVRLEGRVSFTGADSTGKQWIMIKLDGEPDHTVACWSSNATLPNGVDAPKEGT